MKAIASILSILFISASIYCQSNPFVTLWNIDNTLEIAINLNNSFSYDFDYTWIKESDNSVTISGTHVAQGGDFVTNTFPDSGMYLLHIEREFPQLVNYPKEQLLDVIQWGDIQWKSMVRMFHQWPGTGFSAIDAPDLSQVTQMDAMFMGCTNFDSPIDFWDVSNIEDMRDLFRGASSFNQDLNSWNLSNVINTRNMFQDASAFNGNISNWDVDSVFNMVEMFSGATAFNRDLSHWNVGKVNNMGSMFRDATTFNGNIDNWDVGSVTNMSNMFQDADNFDRNIASWNVENVTSMSGMFLSANLFNQEIGSWDVGNVTNMNAMFSSAVKFNQDIGSWDVSQVTSMDGMFKFARAFNQDIGDWDVSNVTNMREMLRNTDFNHDISRWDVSNVTNMVRMFREAFDFDQQLGDWKLNPLVNLVEMLQFAHGMSCNSYSRTLLGWSLINSDITNINFGNQVGQEFGETATTARAFLIDSLGWNISGDNLVAGNCFTCESSIAIADEIDFNRNVVLVAADTVSFTNSSIVSPNKIFVFAPNVNLNESVEIQIGAECIILSDNICDN